MPFVDKVTYTCVQQNKGIDKVQQSRLIDFIKVTKYKDERKRASARSIDQ